MSASLRVGSAQCAGEEFWQRACHDSPPRFVDASVSSGEVERRGPAAPACRSAAMFVIISVESRLPLVPSTLYPPGCSFSPPSLSAVCSGESQAKELRGNQTSPFVLITQTYDSAHLTCLLGNYMRQWWRGTGGGIEWLHSAAVGWGMRGG